MESTRQRVGNSHAITIFGPHDVLFGRTRSDMSFDNNPGNNKLRSLIAQEAPRYHQAASRSGKRKVAREMMATIQDKGGRFLYRHQQEGQWMEARWEFTVAKIKEALRWHQKQTPGPQQIKISHLSAVPSKILTTCSLVGTKDTNFSLHEELLQVLSGLSNPSQFPECCSSFVGMHNRKRKPTSILHGAPPPVDVGPHDVLLGRGRVPFNNPGNKKFRNLILRHAKTYQASTSRITKRAVVVAVVDKINSNGGSFLHFREGAWKEVAKQPIKDKVGYALRDAWLHQNGNSVLSRTPSPQREESSRLLAEDARRPPGACKPRKYQPSITAAPDVQAALQFSLSLQNVFSEIRHIPPTSVVSSLQQQPKQVMHVRAVSPVSSSSQQHIIPFDNGSDSDDENRRNCVLLQEQDGYHHTSHVASNNKDSILSDADHHSFEEQHEQQLSSCRSLDSSLDGADDDDGECQQIKEEECSSLQIFLLECINRDFDDELMKDDDSSFSPSSLPHYLAWMQHEEEEEHALLATTDTAIGVFE